MKLLAFEVKGQPCVCSLHTVFSRQSIMLVAISCTMLPSPLLSLPPMLLSKRSVVPSPRLHRSWVSGPNINHFIAWANYLALQGFLLEIGFSKFTKNKFLYDIFIKYAINLWSYLPLILLIFLYYFLIAGVSSSSHKLLYFSFYTIYVNVCTLCIYVYIKANMYICIYISFSLSLDPFLRVNTKYLFVFCFSYNFVFSRKRF